MRTAINRGFRVDGVMDALRGGRWSILAELSGRAAAARRRADRRCLTAGPARPPQE